MTSTVLVTGAGRGLGLALVKRFLEGGYHVLAGKHHSVDELNRLARDHPKDLTAISLDVSDLDSVRAAAKRAAEEFPALDMVINNAAIYPDEARGTLGALDFECALHVYNVNVLGALRVTQEFMPLLEKGTHKLIVNITSEAGSIADSRRSSEYFYCMSKTALNMQSNILQNALKSNGFKVLAIHPGWMRTDMGGSDADIDPGEAADGIFNLTMRDWDSDDAIYIDYTGKPMRW